MTGTRLFARWEFQAVGIIEPEKDPSGHIIELLPQGRYNGASLIPLHAYGSGPFCRFKVARGRHIAGLYVLTLNDEPVYVGECADLAARFGANGYGGISPRNCFRGGQETNCRINAKILSAAKSGGSLVLWFTEIPGSNEERRNAETKLIGELSPSWNKAKMQSGLKT